MADPVSQAVDKAQAEMERRMLNIYKRAQREIEEKIKAYTKRYKALDAKKRAAVKAGTLSKQEYESWQKGQVFIGEQWKAKKDSIASTLLNANKQANDIVECKKRAVFGESATYQAYQIEKEAGMNLSFSIYDSATVTRIVRDHPELLPRKVVNGQKDAAWNKVKIGTSIVQGVIQGESIDDIAKRIAAQTSSQDMDAMVRYARTAMTSAQNAGRMEMLHEAQGMGIKVKKKWLSTLDNRTRDAHRDLDGQVVEVDEPFQSKLGPIMFPGDPQADPANVYNCRCTMEYVYDGYGDYGQRRDNESKEVIADMTYGEWQESKTNGKLADFSNAKNNLAAKQKEIALSGADHIFKGIWKDDVTYADWEAKKNSISSKRDYYNNAIARAEANGETEKAKELRAMLAELDEFERNGEKNYLLLKERDAALDDVRKIQQSFAPVPKSNGQFASDAWSDTARNNALQFSDRSEADKNLRPTLDKQWGALEDRGKYGVWEYTHNSNPINKSLSGYHESWSRSNFLGYDKTDWGHEDRYRSIHTKDFEKFAENGHVDYHKTITSLTKAIDQCSTPEGLILVRGSSTEGFAGMMEGGGLSFQQGVDLLNGSHSIEEIRNMLVGQRVKNHAFTSTGIASDAGFSGELKYKIYAPKGTHAIYAEPQSYYGQTSSEKMYKPGESYSDVGSEAEMILQRGTVFRIRDIRETFSGYEIEMDIVEQPNYFKFGDEDTFNDGATRHAR